MTISYSEFQGKHVLVSGAARGIGRATAIAFADQGAIVSAVDCNEEALNSLAKAVEGIHPIVCDLTELDDVEDQFLAATQNRGDLSVLVNNAGVDRRTAFNELSIAEWQKMMALNLDHMMLLSKLASPGMSGQAGGAIINLTSTAWMKLAPSMAAYHTAKAGVVGLTRGLARDLGHSNIRVNAIAPGRVYTEVAAAEVNEKWVEETKDIQCLPFLISPEDIANTALWLASGAANKVTGQTIVIDGGVV